MITANWSLTKGQLHNIEKWKWKFQKYKQEKDRSFVYKKQKIKNDAKWKLRSLICPKFYDGF